MSPEAPYILLDDQVTHELRYYTQPVDIVEAHEAGSVEDALIKLRGYHAEGFYLAGYLSYELGFALEPKLTPLMPKKSHGPLLQFGVFEQVSDHVPVSCLYTSKTPELKLEPKWSQTDYTQKFERVMEYIQAGDVYQINLTFPMTGKARHRAETLYAAFRHRQKGRYGGIVSLGSGPEIISLSPELFFRKEGLNMSMRPMKGTRPRADTIEADDLLREDMRGEAKSQAENLMIVDLLRNDLSRISEIGSVEVPELFALETYPTLHQMTSRVTSRLRPNVEFAEIFKSLFPCGSVTGAPKIRAMEIIDELESRPRGAYCGGLGYIDPDGEACFNVAIRTMTLRGDELRYNVGSGLVLDSEASDEYKECLLKADVLNAPSIQLIETFHSGASPSRMRAHKSRLKRAAKALDYPWSDKALTEALAAIKTFGSARRVRLTLNAQGEFDLTHSKFEKIKTLKFSLSRYPLTSEVQITAHKLTSRHFYDGERERINALTGADEVLFVNDQNELCEGSFTSIFVEQDGQIFTPPLSAGILPGILREELVKSGRVREKSLQTQDLASADKIYLGNSLRGLIPALLIDLQPV